MSDTKVEQLVGNGQAPAPGLPLPAAGANGRAAPAPAPVQAMPDDELGEWIDSLEYVIRSGGAERARFLLTELRRYAHQRGAELPFTANTPYVNTIPRSHQPVLPGRREIERRIKSIIRWNAMAMVVRANRTSDNIGGHISSFASGATLIEVAQNHFLRGPAAPRRRGHRLLPGPLRARHVRPRLPGGAAHRAAARQLSPRAAAGRRTLLLSAPLADARLLVLAVGIDGADADHVDLPGALQPLPARPRAARHLGAEGVGVPRRRRDGRARSRSARSPWPRARSWTT